jgi:hypothetical protein
MQLPYRVPPSVFDDFLEIHNPGTALPNVRYCSNPRGSNSCDTNAVLFAPGWKLREAIKAFWTIPVTLRGLAAPIIVAQPTRLQ